MRQARQSGETLSAWAFIAFPVTILMVFTLLPTAAGLGLSFFQWDGAGAPRWVGLGNFAALAGDDRFRAAATNTVTYVIATVPVSVLIAFLLAVAVDAPWFGGKAIARTLFFMPTIVSIVAIGFVWRWLLDDRAGLLNWLLSLVGVTEPPGWLTQGHWPFVWIIVISIWRHIGFCLVLYLAALSNVNRSLHEAAEVDGASRTGVLWHVTWPQVAPMTLFLMVISVISALQVFDIVYVMTARRESELTTVLNLEIYRQFTFGALGYAAAIGVVIFVLTAVATALQLALARCDDGSLRPRTGRRRP